MPPTLIFLLYSLVLEFCLMNVEFTYRKRIMRKKMKEEVLNTPMNIRVSGRFPPIKLPSGKSPQHSYIHKGIRKTPTRKIRTHQTPLW